MTTFTVTNLNDSGLGSLRAAILAANADSGSPTIINFATAGALTLQSDLPTLTNFHRHQQCPSDQCFAGNAKNRIEIGGNASGVLVVPKIVSLNTVGSAALSNAGGGLLIDGTTRNNTISGSQASVIPQNAFSGNLG